jgi:hypothetical protein
MHNRHYLLLLFFCCIHAIATAQEPGTEGDGEWNDPYGGDDSTFVETNYSSFNGYLFGLYGGFTAEQSSLDLAALDPDLGGDLIFYGGEWAILYKSWVFGGASAGATVYDLSEKYDRFEYGYGGFLVGYETQVLSPTVTLRLGTQVGEGEMRMLKKRPDLRAAPGRELLEEYRRNDFFYMRPGIGLGVSSFGFLMLRASVNYLYPVGGAGVNDLKNFSYGLHALIAVRIPNFGL